MSESLVPAEFSLGQNYPNPFRERTTIKYCVPYACRVVMSVLDSKGELVRKLVDEEKQAGTYEVVFEAVNRGGGVYYCSMQAVTFTAVKHMVAMQT